MIVHTAVDISKSAGAQRMFDPGQFQAGFESGDKARQHG
jgi:hypothetical protein